jgi:hypothetical protein
MIVDSLTAAFHSYRFFIADHWATLAAPMIFLVAWIGSASASSSIAEGRGHSPYLHFFVGLFAPLIYPVGIFFALPHKTNVKGGQAGEAEEEALEDDKDSAPAMESTDIFFDPPSADQGFNEAYFKEIRSDNMGNPRGPFLLVVNDDEVRVEKIHEALDKVIIVELLDAEGNVSRARFPYTRISGCTEI